MHSLKRLLKSIPCIFYVLAYLRYLYFRFVKCRRYRSVFIEDGTSIVKVERYKSNQSFFGYYNISPYNKKGEILFCEVATGEVRGGGEELKIYVERDGNIDLIAKSQSWNWQQGCMLQWYAASNDRIIYNNFINGSYFSVILNINTGERKIVDMPIYSVAKSGEFALSLNFERLALMRPDYGYFNRKITWDDIPDDEEDGIWYIDLKNNDKRLILSLCEIKNFKPTSTMDGSVHKVNHIDIAPDGKRFMFLHRWVGSEGRFMRLLTADVGAESKLHYVTGDVMVSHNCWKNNEEIISFCRAIDGKDRYILFKDLKSMESVIGEHDFETDGHPSVSPDGKWMLTDGYPDMGRFSCLYLFDLTEQQKYTVGWFYQPLKYNGENRVDLHPRWSHDGRSVSIDSAHNGKRKLYSLSVKSIVCKDTL